MKLSVVREQRNRKWSSTFCFLSGVEWSWKYEKVQLPRQKLGPVSTWVEVLSHWYREWVGNNQRADLDAEDGSNLLVATRHSSGKLELQGGGVSAELEKDLSVIITPSMNKCSPSNPLCCLFFYFALVTLLSFWPHALRYASTEFNSVGSWQKDSAEHAVMQQSTYNTYEQVHKRWLIQLYHNCIQWSKRKNCFRFFFIS